ncbi:uncharacterized protein LOC134235777 [Saccostrea cucullata]|uniref:uncharacterized protein LOC134235777 n=1 Tax=Saccostrea cuccullata TaxID=36930 RepID=UPI002ED4BC42
MDCVYPYPNIRIDYVKEFDTDSVLSSESEVKFTNGTALNCPVVDSRAISVSGTFTLKDTNLKESAKIKATAMFGTSSATYTISEFTLISVCFIVLVKVSDAAARE